VGRRNCIDQNDRLPTSFSKSTSGAAGEASTIGQLWTSRRLIGHFVRKPAKENQ
jgi:hypothetical protein